MPVCPSPRVTADEAGSNVLSLSSSSFIPCTYTQKSFGTVQTNTKLFTYSRPSFPSIKVLSCRIAITQSFFSTTGRTSDFCGRNPSLASSQNTNKYTPMDQNSASDGVSSHSLLKERIRYSDSMAIRYSIKRSAHLSVHPLSCRYPIAPKQPSPRSHTLSRQRDQLALV